MRSPVGRDRREVDVLRSLGRSGRRRIGQMTPGAGGRPAAVEQPSSTDDRMTARRPPAGPADEAAAPQRRGRSIVAWPMHSDGTRVDLGTPAHGTGTGIGKGAEWSTARERHERALGDPAQAELLAHLRARVICRYRLLLSHEPVLRRIADVRGRPDPFLIYGRLEGAVGGAPTPLNVAALGPQGLRELGMSRAKTCCIANLAGMHLQGKFDTEHLDHLDDEEVVAALTVAEGAGHWTAEIFLFHQLHRPDVLPDGTLASGTEPAVAYALPDVWLRFDSLRLRPLIVRLGAEWPAAGRSPRCRSIASSRSPGRRPRRCAPCRAASETVLRH